MPGKKKSAKQDPNALVVEQRVDQDAAQALAQTALRPSVQNGLTLQAYGKAFGELSITTLIDTLHDQVEATQKGDLGRGEAMLTAQAHTLDAIFNNLARRAVNAEYLRTFDTNLKLALRAQSQCRATWEAVSAIKNPPMVGYVGQANISNGPQQVNNGTQPARARENENPQNELLEQNDGERLDTGTEITPSQTDPDLEAVGTINRTQKR